MTKYRRRNPSRLSAFETLLDRVVGEIFPRPKSPKHGGLGRSRAAKPKRQDFALEAMEPRLLLSADLTYTTLHTAPTSNPADAAQVFFLETDGAPDVDYRGPIIVEDIDVTSFASTGELAGQQDDALLALTTVLNEFDFGVSVIFTTERPEEGEYSTVYIGGTGSEFSQWGHYLGIAEGIDLGNSNRSDTAFVFSDSISASGSELRRNTANRLRSL